MERSVNKEPGSGMEFGQGRRRVTLSAKLLGFTVVLLAVALLSLGLLSINLGSTAILNQANEESLTYAKEGATHTGAVVKGNLDLLNEVASRARVTGMDWNTQVGAIAGDVEKLGYQDIAVMNKNGHAKYILGGQEFDSEGQFWYVDGFNGKTSISDITISKVTNLPVIVEVAPIKSNGEVVGLLVGRRDADYYSAITNAMGDGKRMYGFILSSDGQFIAHPDKKVVEAQTNVLDQIKTDGPFKSLGMSFQALGAGNSGMISYFYNGANKIAAAAPVPGSNWMLAVTKYESDVLAPMDQLRNMVLLISFVILVAGGVAAYIFAKKISKPVIAANAMMQEMKLGHLSQRLENPATDEIAEMSQAMNEFADNLQQVVIRSMNRIADGDVSENIVAADGKDEISPALQKTVESIRGLIEEASMLAAAGVAGRLSTRGDAEAFKGGYRSIVEGVNETLDAVVGPLNVAADYVDRIGRGDIPPKITDNYNGDFNNIKNSINSCLDGLGALVEGSRILKKMSLNDYSEKMEMKAQGIYQEIGESINSVHARLLRVVEVSTHIANGDMSDLEALQAVGRRSDNDSLIPALVAMIVNITRLVEETEKMASTAVAGDLSSRGEAGGFPGEFAKVIEGFNQTLDAVIEPIQEASAILGQLSQGNLHTAMTGQYRGDHAKIKEDLNRTIAFLKDYVEEITATLEEMGKGNLDLEITSDYLGDFQAIKDALNDITTNLSTTMEEINVAAEQVELGAQQISNGGQALSQGTTEQASAIQELTASIEEVAGETKKNAVSANEANERAIEVRTNAEVGNGQMAKMVTAMSEINESSQNISKIIKVIDDIAFQTNILALNAAVEAARAGQHGKGFAVVAEEVRTLAARSAEAAKETTGLIEGSINKVDAGTKIADETAESLREILSEIDKVANLVGNIAKASNDQASEIAQITRGIEQVSQVVQTNSATAEESAAASEELSGQAVMLKDMVGAFKVKGRSVRNRKASAGDHKTLKQVVHQPVEPTIILDDMEMDKY
jgi:methyl-accepting chemotaxis protein